MINIASREVVQYSVISRGKVFINCDVIIVIITNIFLNIDIQYSKMFIK